MSIEKKYYVISGYDLTGLQTDKFSDWRWTIEGEKYTCYQYKGHIQLFDDPMSGNHLYLGYILSSGDEYNFDTSKFSTENVNVMADTVKSELNKLISLGVIKEVEKLELEYQIIAFEECR